MFAFYVLFQKINLKKSIKRVVCNIEMKYLIFVQVFDKQGGKTQA